jgi:hypothetical protein
MTLRKMPDRKPFALMVAARRNMIGSQPHYESLQTVINSGLEKHCPSGASK